MHIIFWDSKKIVKMVPILRNDARGSWTETCMGSNLL